MKKTLLLMSMLSAVLFSCKKEFITPAAPSFTKSIVEKSAAEQVAYAETNLKKIADGFAKLAKNPTFVQYVQTEAMKKFDGQFEVLVEHILQHPQWGKLLNTVDVKEGLAAFKNLEGQNFYPQIYIPRLQNDEDYPNLNTSNITGDDDVRVVIYGGAIPNSSSSSETRLSYEINEDGLLVAWQVIGEPYANNHEVWIFSLNDLLDPLGRLTLPENPICTNPDDPQCYYGGGGGSGSGGTGSGGSGSGGSGTPDDIDTVDLARSYHPSMGSNNPVKCKIQNMVVKQHKDSWLAGGSEISIRAVLNTFNGRSLGNPTGDCEQYISGIGKTSLLGKLVKQFSRKQINNLTSVDVNFILQEDWPTSVTSSDPIYFDYVLFERDIWPTGKQNLKRDENGYWETGTDYPNSYKQFYRSGDRFYDVYRITSSNLFVNTLSTYGSVYYLNGNRSSELNSISFNVIGF